MNDIFFYRKGKKQIDILKGKLRKRQNTHMTRKPSAEESKIINTVMEKTKELNKNNITRTKAYLDFYLRHPEIHWSFLAHMVSRNGGWSMSDLKGELLSRLLSKKEKQSYFSFLERGNWLIFQDAYPQLMLYEESVRKKEPLFWMLPYFNVSFFIEIIWDHCWEEPDSSLLTEALIINEQNYIERRVIQNQVFIKEVFNTLEFDLQDILSFNHILFPYLDYGMVKLAGQTVNQFESLAERIRLGKRLYSILFGEDVLKKMVEWAKEHPHTGSRMDYWPDIFSRVHEGIPSLQYKMKLKSCQLRPGARRIFSPSLKDGWKDVKHEAAEAGEWFKDFRILDMLKEREGPVIGNIEFDYCQTLEKLELAAFAKKVLSILD